MPVRRPLRCLTAYAPAAHCVVDEKLKWRDVAAVAIGTTDWWSEDDTYEWVDVKVGRAPRRWQRVAGLAQE